ncbi:MAG: shikimate dehydrogenase, partial [Oricola sp.]
WIADADPAKAEALVDNVCARHGAQKARMADDLAAAAAIADGIVNATPVGMAHLPGSPVPAELIRPEIWIAEIVYFPIETELLRLARARGCRTLAGSGMAVFQAVRAFELFTGLKPDVSRMEATFRAFDEAPD